MNEPTLVCKGISRDFRTNRWGVTCYCGKNWKPETTMFSRQGLSCPKCGQKYIALYNENPPKLIKINLGGSIE